MEVGHFFNDFGSNICTLQNRGASQVSQTPSRIIFPHRMKAIRFSARFTQVYISLIVYLWKATEAKTEAKTESPKQMPTACRILSSRLAVHDTRIQTIQRSARRVIYYDPNTDYLFSSQSVCGLEAYTINLGRF